MYISENVNYYRYERRMTNIEALCLLRSSLSYFIYPSADESNYSMSSVGYSNLGNNEKQSEELVKSTD